VFDLRPQARVLLVAPFLLIRQGMIALAFVQNAVVDPFRARRSLVLFVGVSFIANVSLFITTEELLLTIMDVRWRESLFANELAADIEADVALVAKVLLAPFLGRVGVDVDLADGLTIGLFLLKFFPSFFAQRPVRGADRRSATIIWASTMVP